MDDSLAKKENDVSRFEDQLSQLEQIVADLEDGDVSLAESLEKYENGVKHLKQCYQLLDVARDRVKLLSGFDENGDPVTETFIDGPETLQEKASRRSKRRSSKAKTADGKTAQIGDIDDEPKLF